MSRRRAQKLERVLGTPALFATYVLKHAPCRVMVVSAKARAA